MIEQKLNAETLITLYEVDATNVGDTIYYFHNDVNELGNEVVWQGITYTAFPIEVTGFEKSSKGKLPRPILRVGNITGVFSSLLKNYDDFIGVKVYRHRVYLKYLDAVNFANGNPTADPNAHFPSDLYYIDRKSAENRVMIEFELASALDINGIKLPRRQIIQNTCQWVYRSSECGYTGTNYFTTNDVATSDPKLDVCGKRLSSCKLRFGDNAELPYGAFVGAGRVR